MCHRGHSAASSITVDPQSVIGVPANALIVGSYSGENADTELCYSCHNGLGSAYDTLSEFSLPYAHSLAPSASEYGPSPKGCYSCHDSHGTARQTGGAPYTALLESLDSAGDAKHAGDEFCTACHGARPGNAFPGQAVWEGTPHATQLDVTDGAQITCSVCHVSHGSSNSALVVEELTPPSVATTVSVPANDRWLCFACHPAASSTYPGGIAYQSSGHGSASTTVPANNEWAGRLPDGSPAASRRVGECQVCHTAMGASDGNGGAVPELARADGTELCMECHGMGSTVAADLESVYSTAGTPVLEVIASYGAAANLSEYGLAHVYTRESSSSAQLASPRQVLEGEIGPTTAGDIDGDGRAEVVVSRAGSSDVSILRRSALAGVSSAPGPATLWAEPEFLAVGDILVDGAGFNEVVAADGNTLRVYRWNGATLAMVDSISTTFTVTGVTTGDVVGTTAADIVATTTGGAVTDNRIVIVTGNPSSLSLSGSYVVDGDVPMGPSIGDLDGSGKSEIAVAINGDNQGVLQVYSGTGGQLAVAGSTSGNQRAQHAEINNLLWGVQAAGRSANEVAVSFADEGDGARVDVFPQTAAGGFGAEFTISLPTRSNPCEMATGDIDGDSREELVIARAGSFSARVPAGIEVLQADSVGTAISGSTFYQAGGIESADSVPGRSWVSIADLGDIGLSRHAVDTTPDTHVSTETDGFSRHVECVDCHNVHESTSTVAAAPEAYGSIRGAWGVSVANSPAGAYTYSLKQGVDYEYELCLKCHGDWASAGDTRNIAEEVDTRNASVHAVEAASTSSQVVLGSFVATATPWTNESVLHCVDCHGNASASEPAGPHASTQAPLLNAPYLGVSTSAADGLCYRCHRYDVYYTGAADDDAATWSRFYRTNQPRRLHLSHVGDRGIGCAACHASHGADEPHLIRSGIGYQHDVPVGGGTCTNDCHGGAARHYEGR